MLRRKRLSTEIRQRPNFLALVDPSPRPVARNDMYTGNRAPVVGHTGNLAKGSFCHRRRADSVITSDHATVRWGAPSAVFSHCRAADCVRQVYQCPSKTSMDHQKA